MNRTLFGGAAAALIGVTLATAAHAQGKWRQGTPIPQGANEVIGAASGVDNAGGTGLLSVVAVNEIFEP
jgi:hypothetical protein